MQDTVDRIRATLAHFPRRSLDRPDLRHAAVTVTLLEPSAGTTTPDPTGAVTDLEYVITRRPTGMRRHAGQWALPGGRLDAHETVEEAALRELGEEVGIHRGPETILGLLDDYRTRSGFVITPLVVWAGRQDDLVPDPGEVAEIHRLPVASLDVDPVFDSIPESSAPVIRLPLLGGFLHAPTAALLYQFREVVLQGRSTRVDHLEQPPFAWK